MSDFSVILIKGRHIFLKSPAAARFYHFYEGAAAANPLRANEFQATAFYLIGFFSGMGERKQPLWFQVNKRFSAHSYFQNPHIFFPLSVHLNESPTHPDPEGTTYLTPL